MICESCGRTPTKVEWVAGFKDHVHEIAVCSDCKANPPAGPTWLRRENQRIDQLRKGVATRG